MEDAPQATDRIKTAYAAMHHAFDEYLDAIEEHEFRYAYQCGYEAAVQQAGQTPAYLQRGRCGMSKDLFDLSAEIGSASMIITGLSNQLDNTKTDTLTMQALTSALFGVSNYLDRIASDLEELSGSRIKEARAAS